MVEAVDYAVAVLRNSSTIHTYFADNATDLGADDVVSLARPVRDHSHRRLLHTSDYSDSIGVAAPAVAHDCDSIHLDHPDYGQMVIFYVKSLPS